VGKVGRHLRLERLSSQSQTPDFRDIFGGTLCAPFAIAQSIVLIAFMVFAALASKRFRPSAAAAGETPLTQGSTLA